MANVQSGTQQKGSLAWVIFLSFVATIGGFLFGFDSGVINGTVNALEKAFDCTAVATGFNVSSMLIGCAIGAFFAGTLADRFGRKPLMMASAVAFTISTQDFNIIWRYFGWSNQTLALPVLLRVRPRTESTFNKSRGKS